MYVSN